MIEIHDEVIAPSFVSNFHFLTQKQNNWITEILFQLQGTGWKLSMVEARNHSLGFFDSTVTLYHPQLVIFHRRMIDGDPKEAAKEVYDIGKFHNLGRSYGMSADLLKQKVEDILGVEPSLKNLQVKLSLLDTFEESCNHEFVNVSFSHIKMVCKHCDQDQ